MPSTPPNPIGLFVQHRAKPGQRDRVLEVWRVRSAPRRRAPAHEAYFFCCDEEDPDVVRVFQLLTEKSSLEEFLAGEWYPEYLAAVSEHVSEAPKLSTTSLVWRKDDATRSSERPPEA